MRLVIRGRSSPWLIHVCHRGEIIGEMPLILFLLQNLKITVVGTCRHSGDLELRYFLLITSFKWIQGTKCFIISNDKIYWIWKTKLPQLKLTYLQSQWNQSHRFFPFAYLNFSSVNRISRGILKTPWDTNGFETLVSNVNSERDFLELPLK